MPKEVDKPADLSGMTIARVEEMVGQKPLDVRVMGKWIVLFFGNCSVRFKQW